MQSRLIYHPLLKHQRSFSIFVLYFVAVTATVGILVRHLLSAVNLAGISLSLFPTDNNPVLVILLSPYFHLALALFSIAVGAGITSTYIVGHIRRIEDWLRDWDAGMEVKPFKQRAGDVAYENIIVMMNQLYEKSREKKRRPKK